MIENSSYSMNISSVPLDCGRDMSVGLLLLHVLVVSNAVALEIYINPKLGNNSLVCLSDVNQPCKSLEFVSRYLGSNVALSLTALACP